MRKQSLPKVKFGVSTIIREAWKFFYICYPQKGGWDWSDVVYEKHPKLKEQLKGVTDKKRFFRICYNYARKFRADNARQLEKAKVKFQAEWDRVNSQYLTILSEHFEIAWRKDKKIMRAYVSIVPINPRNLDEWTFTVGYDDDKQGMIRTTAHEILHFLYFEKWKEVFPRAKRETFDSPHLVWKLSEILAPVIMNWNPNIQKLIKGYSECYEEFQNVKIRNRKLIPYFEDLYRKHLKSNKPFSDFLKVSWEAAKKHRDTIDKL